MNRGRENLAFVSGMRVLVDEPPAELISPKVPATGAPRPGVIIGAPQSVPADLVGQSVQIFGRFFIAAWAETYWPVALDSGERVVAAEPLIRKVGHVPDQDYEICSCSGPYGPDRLCASCDGTGVVPVYDPADPDEEQ